MPAIRSHTRSASPGSIDGPRIEGGQVRVALAGNQQRKRHGPVEEIGSAGFAGALRGTRHVKDIVEHLEGDADLLAERADRFNRPSALQRAQLTGGAEQDRGLQSTALQVALLRYSPIGVLALHELARGQARAGSGERADHRLGTRGGQLGEGAGEE